MKLGCLEGHQVEIERWLASEMNAKCPECEGDLFPTLPALELAQARRFITGAKTFWDFILPFLPPRLTGRAVTLGEGNTPLVHSRDTEKSGKLSFKDESQNPTKSYRDRAAALLVTVARNLGYSSLYCTSHGNMGASIAAYAARAGLEANIFSEKDIDIGKKSQILAFGGILYNDHDTLDQAFEHCIEEQLHSNGFQATAELNPLVHLGQYTIAYEYLKAESMPDEVYISVGNGGTLFSIWQGFKSMEEWGLIDGTPRMIGARLDSPANARVLPLVEAETKSQMSLARHAIAKSSGKIVNVSQEEISMAIGNLARREGLFVEPASAAAYAALEKSVDTGDQETSRSVILTGTGLKAPIVIEAITGTNESYGSTKFQKKMNLRLKILEQLKGLEDGLHGYGIYQNLKSQCSKQAVYQHLKQLHKRHFVIVVEDKDSSRKRYKITPEGMEVLAALDKLIGLL